MDLFHQRVRIEEQVMPFNQIIFPSTKADKMDDVWPIERVWGIIKEKMGGQEFSSIGYMKRRINRFIEKYFKMHEIVSIWQTITPEVCLRLLDGIPANLLKLENNGGVRLIK